ncbi:Major facilitator superfamily domain-containing protein 6 [Stylophora pistillata]|uniref:Major facilitator superfamily domain-containing protein 6 n=1 Tax=Stylophora pistillata TaxID=50429 RepID=A0A2B4SCX4_STYPI|nr:Major facilitator superfamily domain-containing protein 6 [Stylophora pistillata]
MGRILKGGHWKVNKVQLTTWLPTAYYYIFFGSLGSLFPFLNLYYRAVGMDPWQIGILGGIRPLIALLCAPVWSFVSNSEPCLNQGNYTARLSSQHEYFLPDQEKREFGLPVGLSLEKGQLSVYEEQNTRYFQKNSTTGKAFKGNAKNDATKGEKLDHSRFPSLKRQFFNSLERSGLKFEAKTDRKAGNGQRKPYDFKSRGAPYLNRRKNPYSSVIFNEMLFIVFVGEILQSPIDDLNTHFDGTFLEHLGVLYQNVANNNIYSSVGIGLVALSTGLLLHFAPKITICDIEYANYHIAFFIFSLLMTVAIAISLRFDFSYRRCRRSFEIQESLRLLVSSQHFTFVFIVLIMGMLRGVLFNFVYWNIVDIGGSDLVVGFTVVSQYFSDAIMTLSAPIVMTYMGYIGMVYLGLACYALRFLIYSWLSTPNSSWVTPPVELLQGISNSMAWSAFLLYVTSYTPKSTFPTGLFLLQGLYLGVGGSIGGIAGGILIQGFDTKVAFRILGLVSILTCLLFMMIQPSGEQECLPSEADTIFFLADEDDYSSNNSEDEIFDYSQKGVVYIPSKTQSKGSLQAKKMVLPSYSSPLVPICMSLVKKENKQLQTT